MAGKKKSTPKLNTVSPLDQVRLGSQVAGVKASTTPQQWRQIVKLAHSRGYTLAGALSDTPDALKPRLQSSLRTEAQKNTTEAYKPVLADLDSQQRRVEAWDQKRKDDNLAYSAWLATVNQGVATQSLAAAQTLGAANQTSRDSVTQAWDAIQAGTKANTAGGVSDPSQSSALAQIGNARTASEANAQTAFDTTSNKLKNDVAAGGLTTQAINAGFASQADASRRADISQALQSLTDSRTKTKIQQATDYLSAFSKLKDTEITKAQYLSDTDIARQKLLGEGAKLALDTKRVNHSIATDSRKDRNAAADTAIRQNKYGLDLQKADYNGDGKFDAQDNVDRRADALAKSKNKDGGTPATDKAYSRKLEGNLSATYTNLIGLHADYKRNPALAKKTKQTPDRFRVILGKRGAKNTLISLAEDAHKNGGKLSAAGRKKARELGILHPETIDLN
jgi:hypothetical protein